MPHPRNLILERLNAGKTANVYCAGNLATPRMVDFIGRLERFDVIWFDLEHFAIPMADLAVLGMIARGHGMGTIARVKASDYQEVMRILETGMDGLMCAMVEDEVEASQIVKWARFFNPAPAAGEAIGQRGWNGGNIDACYGNIPPQDYIRHQNTQTVILAQIEHAGALSRAKEIAATPGIDGLFFGPADYATSLGFAGQLAHPDVDAAMIQVGEAARAAGKWWGSLAVTREMQIRARSLGARFLSPGGDVKIMNLGLRELAKIFEDLPSAATDNGEAGR